MLKNLVDVSPFGEARASIEDGQRSESRKGVWVYLWHCEASQVWRKRQPVSSSSCTDPLSGDLLSRTTALACGGDKGVQSAIQCVRIRGATAHIEELLAISGPENRGGDFAWGAT